MDDIEYQRQIIDTFINAIYVYDDKLVFTYNFKDGTETVPLKAVEDAFGSDLTQVAPPNPRNPNIIPIGDGFGFLLFTAQNTYTPLRHGAAVTEGGQASAHRAPVIGICAKFRIYKKSPHSR